MTFQKVEFLRHLLVNAVTITSDSKTLLSASDDKTIKVWSLNPPKLHSTLPKQEDELLCVVIASDNQTLINGDEEGNFQLWNLQTGEGGKLGFGPTKAYLGRSIRIWNIKTKLGRCKGIPLPLQQNAND